MPSPSVTYTFSNSTTADASQVNQNFTDLINGLTDGTKDLSISALAAAGAATLNGNVTLGNASSDDLTITASLASTINIKTTATYSFGSATKGLLALYFSNSGSNTSKLQGLSSLASDVTHTLPKVTGTLAVIPDTVAIANSDSPYTATFTSPTILANATAGAITVNLPAASGNDGQVITVKKTDSSDNAVTVDGSGSETIDGDTTFVLRGQYDTLTIVCDGSNWQIQRYHFKPTYLAQTTAQFTGGAGGHASNEYCQMSSNSISLTPGKWHLSGSFYYDNNGSGPTYGYFEQGWFTANGANTTSEPTAATTEAGYYKTFLYPPSSVNNSIIEAPNVRIAVTSTTAIYLVSRFTATTVGNARVTGYLYAERVG